MSKCHFAVFNTVITRPEFWGKLIQKYMFLLSSGKGRQGMPRHKSPAAVAGEVARNQALKISRLFHEKMKTMVEI